jgi:hypothetical protein
MVDMTVSVVIGAGVTVEIMVSVTVAVVNCSPAVPVGAPPFTGTTEYDALGCRTGSKTLGCEKNGNAELGKNNEDRASSRRLEVWCRIASL